MKDKLKTLPRPLQKQVVFQLGAGIVFLLLMALIWILFTDACFALPCLLLSGFLLVNGSRLFYIGSSGSYICIRGTCVRIETFGFRKSIKSIELAFDGFLLKIPVRQRMNLLSIGDTVIVYLLEKAPVYEQDGVYMVCSYYVLEAEKRCNRDGGKQGNAGIAAE